VCGVVIDLENSLALIAPGNSQPTPRNQFLQQQHPITVEVIEPTENQPSTPRNISILEDPYRIPRRSVPIQKPKTHRLSKKKAFVLADKQAKKELKAKKKVPPRNKRFCKLCQVSCNGSKTFYDHVNSRSHRIRLENKKEKPYCNICKRTFESHGHLQRHLNGAAHLKIVLKNKTS